MPEAVSAAKARRLAAKRDAELRAPFKGGDPITQAAHEAGGVCMLVHFNALEGANGGCGSPTHVEGTNGGTMPCGSLLSRFGETAPYYCGHCDPR